ncbi:MAG: penicillin-binding transpeptidase domain-containing protein [bacterium]|nr:penicillin-binding transpeptidase domain-containing protein [bacterium]
MRLFRMRARRIHEIDPDEIFLDSSNLPSHNERQFEGRVEHPVSPRAIWSIGVAFLLLASVFSVRSYNLQISHGTDFANISRDNRLDRSLIFATRGIIYDRTGRELAWNESPPAVRADVAIDFATSSVFALRKYSPLPGLSHLIGFVRYPKADAGGTWWREEYAGISGVELSLDVLLKGENGSTMREIDAHNRVVRENLVSPPRNGSDVTLSIDAEVESQLYKILSAHAIANGFEGGASVIMDVRTGEILALASFPEYNHAAFTDGDVRAVREAINNPRTPMLNRAVAGAYTPGSIVKPIFAAGALKEGIISPDKQILSTGAIKIPNPYDPEHPSVFRDWTVHGLVDMRTALAVSSDEYFYTIGGGYGGQRGLGISRLDEYARRFGLGTSTGIALLGEVSGVIPTPAWKEQVFGKDDPWRIGDTYHTAIGQYGFQITPLQAVRFTSAIANGGRLLTPQLLSQAGEASSTTAYLNVGIQDADLQVVREGMRLAVVSTRKDATVKFFNIRGIHLAAKTGTAQTGVNNESMNSWSIGFWPAENPRYAYATVLEKAPAGTLSGAAPAMLPFFQWLIAHKPEYVN